MRKIFIVLLFFISASAFVQTTIRFGLEAGPNMTFPYHGLPNNSETAKSAYGFWGGALMVLAG